MNFNIKQDFAIFNEILQRRPEIDPSNLRSDLENYYLPYLNKLLDLAGAKTTDKGIIVGVSAIQGAGKTTQGEIVSTLLSHEGVPSISLSIDDHYLTHDQLNKLREVDPRYIRRGVTHDIPLAIKNLTDLSTMADGQEITIAQYDKSAFNGDGDRYYKTVSQKPKFIFYDGWMLGARKVDDESVFSSGLPALETAQAQEFARDINQKLTQYEPLWEMIDYMNVLYVPHYQVSLDWREEAEKPLQKQGKGMSPDQIKEFVYYFWRSVHPAIQIRNLACDESRTDQVVIIDDNHLVKEVISPAEVAIKYPLSKN